MDLIDSTGFFDNNFYVGQTMANISTGNTDIEG